MNIISKLGHVFGLLPKHPVQFYDRILAPLEFRYDRLWDKPAIHNTVGVGECIRSLENVFHTNLAPFMKETALKEIEEHVYIGSQSLRGEKFYYPGYNADSALAKICYLICRVLVPSIVVETGVAYGVSSAFMLEALARNGKGALYSIDLPPLTPDGDRYIGALIPPALRGRWHLSKGRSRRILPHLLSSLQGVDFFLHDSLHTGRNVRFELETVWPFLRPGGIIIADDVHENSAFEDFAKLHDVTLSKSVQEEAKDSIFGVMVKRS